jgi:restriction endonuclease S subunit
VYEPDREQLHPTYLTRLIQTSFFKDYLWRKKVGSAGRKEVTLDLFESTLIPLPLVPIQKALVAEWERIDAEKQKLDRTLADEQARLDRALIKAKVGQA